MIAVHADAINLTVVGDELPKISTTVINSDNYCLNKKLRSPSRYIYVQYYFAFNLWLNFKIKFFICATRFHENIANADVSTPVALNMSIDEYSKPTRFRPTSRLVKCSKLVLCSFLKY